MINFVRLAILFGYLGFFLGLVIFTMGIILTFSSPDAAQHYFNKSSGQVIDGGITYIVFGVILGALGEIGKAVIKEFEN